MTRTERLKGKLSALNKRRNRVLGSLERRIRRHLLNHTREVRQLRALRPLVGGTASLAQPLSEDQLERFHREGCLWPFTLCTPDEMREIREYLRGVTLQYDCPVPGFPNTKWRHIDDPVVYRLCAHPVIVERVSTLLGPNVLLWQSNLFDKPPGSSEIPWHQDRLFLEVEGGTNVSAWIAMDDVDEHNACIEVIRGSHRRIVPPADPGAGRGKADQAFGRMADPRLVDDSQAAPVRLRAGEFMLFHEFLLHRSAANRSHRQRLGLAVRFTTPQTRVTHQMDSYHTLLIRGRDLTGINRMGLPPPSPCDPES